MAEGTTQLLLIDDDQFLRDLYAAKFKAQGLEVTTAGNAHEALESLRGGLKPHAIVFDIVMPQMDGYEFLEVLRRDQLAPEALTIALSNQSDEHDEERLKKLGVDSHLTKASNIPSEIVEQVTRLLQEKNK